MQTTSLLLTWLSGKLPMLCFSDKFSLTKFNICGVFFLGVIEHTGKASWRHWDFFLSYDLIRCLIRWSHDLHYCLGNFQDFQSVNDWGESSLFLVISGRKECNLEVFYTFLEEIITVNSIDKYEILLNISNRNRNSKILRDFMIQNYTPILNSELTKSSR